jgi:hypothetical protein
MFHNKGFVGELLHLFDRRVKLLGVCVAGNIQVPMPPALQTTEGKLGNPQILHTALYDGILDSEHLGKPCFH